MTDRRRANLPWNLEDLSRKQWVLGPHGEVGAVIMTPRDRRGALLDVVTRGHVRIWYRDWLGGLDDDGKVKDELIRECIPLTKLTREQKAALEEHGELPRDKSRRLRGYFMTEYRCPCHGFWFLSNLASRDWWALYNVSGVKNILYLQGVTGNEPSGQ